MREIGIKIGEQLLLFILMTSICLGISYLRGDFENRFSYINNKEVQKSANTLDAKGYRLIASKIINQKQK